MQNSIEKVHGQKNISQLLGRGSQNTCANNQDLFLENGEDVACVR